MTPEKIIQNWKSKCYNEDWKTQRRTVRSGTDGPKSLIRLGFEGCSSMLTDVERNPSVSTISR